MQLIPNNYQELESIVSLIDSEKATCIGVTSPSGSGGASSLTLSLANRFKTRTDRILVLDLNQLQPFKRRVFHHSVELPEWQFENISSQLSVTSRDGLYFLSIEDLSSKELARDTATVTDTFKRWQQEFDYIFIDMSALLSVNKKNLPTSIFSNVIEVMLLVVSIGRTTEDELSQCASKLKADSFRCWKPVVSQVELPPLGPLLEKKVIESRWLPNALQQYFLKMTKRQAWLYRPIGA